MTKITLTSQQQRVLDKIIHFIDSDAKVFILSGYAGTGKTTMVKKLIEELGSRHLSFSLLASTGRAAKILANATDAETRTVHSEIYKFTDLNLDMEKVVTSRENTHVDSSGQLFLNFELTPVNREDKNDVHYYIVDEASMISDTIDKNATQAIFGSGMLLTDLFEYDHQGKFIFVGDTCQLPPVNQSVSPALSSSYLRNTFGMEVMDGELTEVIRQSGDNDIAVAAQRLRKLYFSPQPWKWAKFPLRGFKDIHILDSQTSLVSEYIQYAKREGFNKATLIGFSNKQCDMTTKILRPSFGHNSEMLERGDLLLVTQNNLVSGLMNGDLVTVEDVVIQERRAGLTFLKVSVKELFSGRVVSQLVIADVLYGNQTNLSQPQQKELFIDFYYRMKEKGIKQKSSAFKNNMLIDPYLNALRAVFGYALTCHKSQGGEWDYVFLDIPRNVPVQPKPYVYQWVYTAMTRARKGLFLVNDFWLM